MQREEEAGADKEGCCILGFPAALGDRVCLPLYSLQEHKVSRPSRAIKGSNIIMLQ